MSVPLIFRSRPLKTSLLVLVLGMGTAIPIEAFAANTKLTFVREKVPFTVNGVKLTGQIMKPKTVAPDTKLPLMLLFGGFQNAAKILDLIQPKSPVIVGTFDYPFSPPRKFEFPQSLGLAPEARSTIRNTVAGIPAFIDELIKRPDTDAKRISMIGASLGSPFAVIAASRDPRVRGLVSIHGFGEIQKTITLQLSMGIKKHLGPLTHPVAATLAWIAIHYLGLDTPEEATRSLQPHQSVLNIAARSDRFIPAGAKESLHAAFGQSNAAVYDFIEMPGEHLQPGKTKMIKRLLDRVTVWLEFRNLL